MPDPLPPKQGDAPDPALPADLENALADAFWRDPAIREERLHGLVQAHPEHRDALLQRIKALEAHLAADQQPEADRTPTFVNADDQQPEHIGEYRILDVLGEGGMGTVYLAEQRLPVRRRVALKVIKLGMDTKEVLNRFEAERQALAMMEHSCIAKVLDAGQTREARPYFVMEYIRGSPITRYCDAKQLDVEARLRLFVRVCAGVQHAHSKGIIHRDLKPSNILVTTQEQDPVPKIIDFGLARATDHRLIEATVFTRQGQIVGTPEYMSPEQAGLEDLDIDTRTDVYSLGVILYELLVGDLPLPSTELRRAGLLEFQRMIREVEPRKPSTRLSGTGPATESARIRKTSAVGLARQLRGDLDWIVMKALEKDRARRYTTPLELAADIERHLACEPVLAGPPSTIYRLRKLVRRHRVPFAAGTLVFATAIVGAIVAWWFALDAQNERARFDRLSTGVLLQDARAEMAELQPAWPNKLEALQQWITKWASLRDDAARIQETIAALESRATRRPDPSAHPRFAEIPGLRKKLAALEHAAAVREKGGTVPSLPLPKNVPAEALRVVRLAERYVGPDRPPDAYGEEPVGLAVAKHALQLAQAESEDSDAKWRAHLALAWAHFANGLDADAKREMALALATAPFTAKKLTFEANTALNRALADTARQLDKTRDELLDLERAAAEWSVIQPAAGDRFLYSTLQRIAIELDAFLGDSGELAEMQRRRYWATKIADWTLHHPDARQTWAAARSAIRAADGVRASERYAARPIDLQPQTGLVPIGMNPITKLWEFYHLRSAVEISGMMDAAGLAIPEHAADGSIKVQNSTGIVFVLVPGGSFTMGAQSTDRSRPNYDPMAKPNEFPHRVTLEPYFLARHELTIGQWQRLSGSKCPNVYGPGIFLPPRFTPVDERHPVENATWIECQQLLLRFGLAIPTEAQWEYACRAGAKESPPWSPGPTPRNLMGYTNILDWTAQKTMGEWNGETVPFRDRHVIHAPAGSFKANAFGLFDMHGNVQEWCRDWYGEYDLLVTPGDAERIGGKPLTRIHRGGSYNLPAMSARSAYRNYVEPSIPNDNRGVRPARALIE